jgi:hypothetical protein
MRNRKRGKTSPSGPQKAPALADIMKIALFIHENGTLWVVHDKPLPERLEWLDFDGDDRKITFIGYGGKPMELGLNVPDEYLEPLLDAEYVMAAHVENDQIINMTIVPVVTRMITEEEEV